MRTRYEPPTVDARSAPANTAPQTPIFARPLHGELVPWVLGEVAANSAPEPARPSEEELEAYRDAAREMGLVEGRQAASAELDALRERFAAEARTSLEGLATVRGAMIDAMRDELLDLAVVLAEAVIQREIDGARLTAESLLGQALLELDPHERCTISVCPDELSWVGEWAKANWPAALVRGDPALGRAELRVESARGKIEALRASRLERLRRLVSGSAG